MTQGHFGAFQMLCAAGFGFFFALALVMTARSVYTGYVIQHMATRHFSMTRKLRAEIKRLEGYVMWWDEGWRCDMCRRVFRFTDAENEGWMWSENDDGPIRCKECTEKTTWYCSCGWFNPLGKEECENCHKQKGQTHEQDKNRMG